jgi:DNA-binding MarR family transcriptional regulator
MSLKMTKFQVLAILSENLKNPRPQLVPTSVIAGQLKMELSDLQYVLKTLDGMGVIQTDPDLRYNLITRKGLHYLDQHHPDV